MVILRHRNAPQPKYIMGVITSIKSHFNYHSLLRFMFACFLFRALIQSMSHFFDFIVHLNANSKDFGSIVSLHPQPMVKMPTHWLYDGLFHNKNKALIKYSPLGPLHEISINYQIAAISTSKQSSKENKQSCILSQLIH